MYFQNIYKIFLVVLLFGLIIFSLYFFYFFPIKNVSTDENYLKKEQFISLLNSSIGKIFLLEKKNIKNSALAFDSHIKNVYIDRLGLGNIKVYIEEYKPIALWCGGDYEYFSPETECYYVDQVGFVYSKLEEENADLKETLPKIFGYFEDIPNRQNFDSSLFIEIRKIVFEVSYISGKLIVTIDDDAITLYTDAGKIILPRNDSKDNLENAIIFLKANRGKTFEYIDARHGNSIFFK